MGTSYFSLGPLPEGAVSEADWGCSRIHGDDVERRFFIEAAGDVEVLDGLAGRAFDEVVNGRERDDAVRAFVNVPGDVAVVRAAHVFCRRVAISSEQADEEFLAVELFIRGIDEFGRRAIFEVGVARREDAASHRDVA